MNSNSTTADDEHERHPRGVSKLRVGYREDVVVRSDEILEAGINQRVVENAREERPDHRKGDDRGKQQTGPARHHPAEAPVSLSISAVRHSRL